MKHVKKFKINEEFQYMNREDIINDNSSKTFTAEDIIVAIENLQEIGGEIRFNDIETQSFIEQFLDKLGILNMWE